MHVKIALLKDYLEHRKGERFVVSKSDAEKLVDAGIAEIITQCKSMSDSKEKEIADVVNQVIAKAVGRVNPAAIFDDDYGQPDLKTFWHGTHKVSLSDYGEDVKHIGDFIQGVLSDGKSFSSLTKSDFGQLVNSDGGYLVPESFATSVLTSALEDAGFMNAMTNITMDTAVKQLPYLVDEDRSGTLGMYGLGLEGKRSTAEGAALTDITPKLGMMELRLNKVGGRARISNEILEDSPVQIAQLLHLVFSQALRFDMISQVISGDGSGEALGLVNSPSKIEVAKTSGQAADSITYQNVLKMFSRMAPECRSDPGCCWLINQDCMSEIFSMSVDGSGASPVMIASNSVRGGTQDLGQHIFGKKIYWSEHCATLGDANDIILFSPRSCALAKKPTGMRIESSMHERFSNDEQVMRAIMRLDFQSLWKSARTPVESSATVSNIVTLAERA